MYIVEIHMTTNTEAYDIKIITFRSRLIKALSIGIPCISLSIWFCIEILKGNDPIEKFIIPLILLIAGCYFSWKAFTTKETRELARAKIVTIDEAKREKAKSALLLGGLAMGGLFLMLYSFDSPPDNYLLGFFAIITVLLFYIVPTWSPKVSVTLTAPAAAEKARLEEIQAIAALEYQKKEDYVMEQWWFRYPSAALMVVGAWWLSEVKPNLWWVSVLLVLVAMIFARELSGWIIGLAILWAVFTGIAALPVATAIIIGALIIASAMK